MAIRFIPSLPRGGIVDNENTSRHISRRIHDAYIMQNNIEFMQSPVTGSDGTIYTWVEDKNHRKGFNDSSGYVKGNAATDLNDTKFDLYDKVGAGGSYIIKLGGGTSVNQRWLRGVVGFDARFCMYPSSIASTNDPWVGKIGLIYYHPTSDREFIYRPTVTMVGPTGDIPTSQKVDGSFQYRRLARKISFGTDAWQTIHDIDLLFTGIIFEYGHSTGGGADPTRIHLNIKDFKPIFSVGRNSHVSTMSFGDFKTYELLPRMRSYDERDDIAFDTNVDVND